MPAENEERDLSSPGWHPDAVVNQREYTIEGLHSTEAYSIGPVFNVGKSTLIEAIQDVMAALFKLKDEYIHFPQTVVETTASIGTFKVSMK